MRPSEDQFHSHSVRVLVAVAMASVIDATNCTDFLIEELIVCTWVSKL